MGKKLYVGNLSYETTDADLTNLFSQHGQVASAQVIMDRDTGRSKGFGFGFGFGALAWGVGKGSCATRFMTCLLNQMRDNMRRPTAVSGVDLSFRS